MDIDDFGNLCMGCMQDKGDETVCPKCGYQMDRKRNPAALPYQAILHNKFLVGRILGRPGGFGITYLAWDLVLHTALAIKEYLPRDLVTRDTNHLTVVPYSQDREALQEYQRGLRQFLNEARTLGKFSHPNVVRVREFFEQNNTAYIAMDYYEGISLEEYLKRNGGVLDESAALALLMPVLDGLREVHAKGFLHRDIKPDNIYLTKGGTPILLDFGATRLALHGQRSRPLSIIFTPGFAPYEQYLEQTESSPTLDIYSIGATLYYLLTGLIPQAAVERMQKDSLAPPDQLVPSLSARTSRAIMQALALKPEQRQQNIDALWAQLFPGEPAGAATRSLPRQASTAPKTPAPQLRCVHCKASNPVPSNIEPSRLYCVRCGKRLTRPQGQSTGWWWLAGAALLALGFALPWRAEKPASPALVQNPPTEQAAPSEEPPKPPPIELYTPQPLAQTANPGSMDTPREPPQAEPTPSEPAEDGSSGGMAPLSASSMARDETRPGRPIPGYPPPQSAIDACQGKQSGMACVIELPDRQELGTCRQIHAYFACAPAGGPPPAS